jgi:hypothetical protein
MFNPFFYEFRVMPSVNVFQLVCYTYVHHKGCRQESCPDWRLAHLSRRRGARGHAFLMMEGWFAQVGAAEMQATANFSNDDHSNYAWHGGSVLYGAHALSPVFTVSCLRHNICVQTVYRDGRWGQYTLSKRRQLYHMYS